MVSTYLSMHAERVNMLQISMLLTAVLADDKRAIFGTLAKCITIMKSGKCGRGILLPIFVLYKNAQ